MKSAAAALEVDGMAVASTSETGSNTRTRRSLEVLVALAGMSLLFLAWKADLRFFERHFLHGYCVRFDEIPQRITIARSCMVAAGLVIAILLRAPLARALTPKNRWGLHVQVVIAIYLALVVSDRLIARHDKFIYVPTAHFLPSEAYGWTFEPSLSSPIVIEGRSLEYFINAQGNHARSIDDLPDPSRPTIIFTGESIAAGHGLRYEESYAALVGEHLGVQVVNVAVHGYGNDQAYLRMLDTLPHFSHVIAVVTTFIPDQIVRNTRDDHRLLELGADGRPVRVGPIPAWERALELSALREHLGLWHGDRAIDLTRAIFRGTVDAARAKGAFPLFFATNFVFACKPDDGDQPWILRTLFDDEHLSYVRSYNDAGGLLINDWHPNAASHRKFAGVIEQALRDAKVVGP